MDDFDDMIKDMWWVEVESQEPINEKAAEKERKQREKEEAARLKAEAKAQKEADELIKAQEAEQKKQALEGEIQKETISAQEKHAKDNQYPNLKNTDIKFVLDSFFKNFSENNQLSVYGLYDYFEKFFDLRSRLDAKAEELEQLAGQLETFKDYEVYDKFEFALFYFTIWFADETKRFLRAERDLEKQQKELFSAYRPKYPSDASTEKAVDNILKEQIDTIEAMKENQKSREIKIKGYVRLAEHIKSDNIKEMSEAKRLESLQNTNPHYRK